MSKEKQDMTDLIETALHAENKVKRSRAVRRINDPEILTHIALHDRAAFVRIAALERLEDAELLLHIALCDPVKKVRAGAIKRLGSEEIKIEDMKALFQAAGKDKEGTARSVIVKRLDDQELLLDFAFHDDSA